MPSIVSRSSQVLEAVNRFADEVAESKALQGRLAYARAWYAHKNKGKWRFGPSKFVGYENLSAEGYIKTAEHLNGRRTEAQLHQWFTEVRSETELYEELRSALFAFLAKYGKAPSTKMRINVLEEHDETREGHSDDAIVELMLAVAKSLPKTHLDNLRARLRSLKQTDE